MTAPPSCFTWVTDHLAIGSAPMSYDALDCIRNQGITCILNLCAEFTDLHWIEADAGFETYYLPIRDEHAPQALELEKALEWIDEAIYLGKKVLIHCRYGVGRTGTVLTAYLIRRGFSPRTAEKRLKQVKAGPGNFSQWMFLRGWGRRLGRLTIRDPALERDQGVDLSEYFAEYERLVEDVETRLGLNEAAQRCGLDHARCCASPVVLGLTEAVYLAHKSQLVLAREERLPAEKRASAAAAFLARNPGAPWPTCPLSDYGQCLLYDFRPLACRLADLDPERANERAGVEAELGLKLSDLSARVFAALAPGGGCPEGLAFPLPQAISGDYVRVIFDILLKTGACGPPG